MMPNVEMDKIHIIRLGILRAIQWYQERYMVPAKVWRYRFLEYLVEFERTFYMKSAVKRRSKIQTGREPLPLVQIIALKSSLGP